MNITAYGNMTIVCILHVFACICAYRPTYHVCTIYSCTHVVVSISDSNIRNCCSRFDEIWHLWVYYYSIIRSALQF